MRETLIALMFAWAVYALVGCGGGKAPQQWRGDHSSHVYQERGTGFVQDTQTGQTYYRAGPNWVVDAHGKYHYLYGGVIEDRSRE